MPIGSGSAASTTNGRFAQSVRSYGCFDSCRVSTGGVDRVGSLTSNNGAVQEQALVVADRAGVIRLWNEQATAMFGHTEADAVGATLDLIVPEHFRVRHWAGYQHAWDEGISDDPRVALLPVLCADGEIRRFPGRLFPVRGPHGQLAAVAGIWSPPSDQDADLFVFE
jgi:PAS domain S-box-containing protein